MKKLIAAATVALFTLGTGAAFAAEVTKPVAAAEKKAKKAKKAKAVKKADAAKK